MLVFTCSTSIMLSIPHVFAMSSGPMLVLTNDQREIGNHRAMLDLNKCLTRRNYSFKPLYRLFISGTEATWRNWIINPYYGLIDCHNRQKTWKVLPFYCNNLLVGIAFWLYLVLWICLWFFLFPWSVIVHYYYRNKCQYSQLADY